MNRLLCFLTGGHRYADTGLKPKPCNNPNYMTYYNECIKCGKTTQFDVFIGSLKDYKVEGAKTITIPKYTYTEEEEGE